MPARLLFFSDESDLVARIQRGDRKALVYLFDANRRPVSALVTRNGGTADDADDVLQEAVIVAWEKVRSGAFEPKARLGTFIYAVAKHVWLRKRASSRRMMPALDEDDERMSDDRTPLDDVVDHEGVETLTSAFRSLSEQCRTLLLLFYWEQLAMDEIGSLLGFANADTAKAKKYQCMARLRELVQDSERQ